MSRYWKIQDKLETLSHREIMWAISRDIERDIDGKARPALWRNLTTGPFITIICAELGDGGRNDKLFEGELS